MQILQNEEKVSKIIHIILLILLFLMSLFLAWNAGFETAPDEGMKFELIKYIAENNKLPHGGDPAIINHMWGTSYAFTPYLSYICSAMFVKVFMLFTSNIKLLVFASRLVSLLFYILYFEMIWKISKKLFKDKFKYFFTVICTFLPSIVYLGTYINTDMFCLFIASFIFLQWLNGIEKNWDYKTCILLGLGLGLCFLSHYYYYGYILCSFIIYLISNYIKKNDFKTFFKKGLVIFIITFIISGWWFIRQYRLYDGDIFALNISSEYAEKYADLKHKPSYLEMKAEKCFVFGLWLLESIYTIYGEFRYNDIRYNPMIYCIFLCLIFVGLLMAILKLIFDKPDKKLKIKKAKLIEIKRENILLNSIMLLSIIIPIILSAYYSSTSDYQPQGRYLLPGYICLATFITYGYKFLFKNKEKAKNIFISIIITIFLVMPIYTYFDYLKGNIEVKIENRTG